VLWLIINTSNLLAFVREEMSIPFSTWISISNPPPISQVPHYVEKVVGPNVGIIYNDHTNIMGDWILHYDWEECAYTEIVPNVYSHAGTSGGSDAEFFLLRNYPDFGLPTALHLPSGEWRNFNEMIPGAISNATGPWEEILGNGDSNMFLASGKRFSVALRYGYGVEISDSATYANKIRILKSVRDVDINNYPTSIVFTNDFITSPPSTFSLKYGRIIKTTTNPNDTDCGSRVGNGSSLRYKQMQFQHMYDDRINSLESFVSLSDKSIVDEGYLDWRLFSASHNSLYYDPDVTYYPWPGYPDADFTAVRSHPDANYIQNYGTTTVTGLLFNDLTDLTNRFYAVASDTAGYTGDKPMRLNGTNYVRTPNGETDWWDDYILYQIENDIVTVWINEAFAHTKFGQPQVLLRKYRHMGKTIRDPVEVERIKQNFANWYQYYRRGSYTLKATTMQLVEKNPLASFQLSFTSDEPVNVNLTGDKKTNKDALISSVALNNKHTINNSTQASNNYNKLVLGLKSGIENSCQFHHVLHMSGNGSKGVTKGLFAGYVGDRTVKSINQQITTDEFPMIYKDEIPGAYPKQHYRIISASYGLPVNGTASSPLLFEPSLSNYSPGPALDRWDAAVTEGIVFSRNFPGFIENIQSKIKYTRLFADTTRPGRLFDIKNYEIGAGLAAGFDSKGNVNGIYQAIWDGILWAGDLIAYQPDSQGVINQSDTPKWKLSYRLYQAHGGYDHSQNVRVMITMGKFGASPIYKGVPFRNGLTGGLDDLYDYIENPKEGRSNTSAAMGLSDAKYVSEFFKYYRGSPVPGTLNYFRDRTIGPIGTIINSVPAWVGAPSESYPDQTDWKENINKYEDFVSLYKDRTPMVYVGSNDGMLHGVNASTGDEVLSYVPRTVFSKLHAQAKDDYHHTYTMDGSPVIKDVYFDSAVNPRWRTVLVSSLGRGGRAVFALDITDPTTFNDGNAEDIALWENNHEISDPDIGYIIGKPIVTKLGTKDWVTAYGNGFNSTENESLSTGDAYLFVNDIKNGNLLKKIPVNRGTRSSPNGLMDGTALDIDDDQIADFIYAGDIKGNMWKFDLRGNSSSDWEVAFGGEPLFAAGPNKPIMGAPVIRPHPNGGYMIYFGTGLLLTDFDTPSSGYPTQTIYGIWDKSPEDKNLVNNSDYPIDEKKLLTQSVLSQFLVKDGLNKSQLVRQTTNNGVDWTSHRGWKMNMELPMPTGGYSNFGERSIASFQLVSNGANLVITTVTPELEVCELGITSFIMEVDALTGSRLGGAVFDTNGDGSFDKTDSNITNQIDNTPSDQSFGTPIPTIPYNGLGRGLYLYSPLIVPCKGNECKYYQESGGKIKYIHEKADGIKLNLGRQSWRRLMLTD